MKREQKTIQKNKLDFGNPLETSLINTLTLCGFGICLAYLLYTLPAGYYQYSLFNGVGAVICLSIYLFNKWKRYTLSLWTSGIGIPLLLVGFVYQFGFIHTELYLLGAGIVCSYLVRNRTYGPELVWTIVLVAFLSAKAILLYSGRIKDLSEMEGYLYLPNAGTAVVLLYLSTRFFRKQHEAERTGLEEERSELEASNHLKEKLLSLVSHDLRSPFNSMKALIALKRDGDITTEQWDLHLGKLGHEIDRTSSFIDNVLFWVKQQMNGIEVQNDPVNITEIALINIAQLQNTIDEKKITVHKELTAEATVSGDSEMLGIIVRNILTNALKFTKPESGEVWIRTQRAATYIQLEIRDNGIGMTQEAVNNLLKGHVNSSQGTLQEKGFGIGMQLVKTFSDMMKIDLHISSEKAVGTSFQLRVPLHQPAV